jgi:hypothetical protein
MQIVQLEIEDSNMEIVLNILKNLKDNLISKCEIKKEHSRLNAAYNTTAKDKYIDFSQYNVTSFASIKDPLEYQKSIREEWN